MSEHSLASTPLTDTPEPPKQPANDQSIAVPSKRPSPLVRALTALCEAGSRIRFEECRGRIVCAGFARLPDGTWTDRHTTEFRASIARRFGNISASDANAAVAAYARRNAFNALTDWVRQCASHWDGKPRIDRAFVTYWGAGDNAATMAASRIFFLSLAARALKPGCKVDTCPVLTGKQGIKKSLSLRTLVGDEWFSDSPLPIGEKDAMQNIRGKWLWELAELDSLARREVTAIKAYLSTQIDTFRSSYGHHTEDVPRQVCFVGSTNEDEFLRDATGNRRFLPVRVGDAIDVTGVERDREQLIGEAARRVLDGEQWWPTTEEDAALDAVREEHEESDAWDDLVRPWLAKVRASKEPEIQILDLFGNPLDEPMGDNPPINIERSRVGRRETMRAAAVLKRLHYERHQIRERGPHRGEWWWRPKAA